MESSLFSAKRIMSLLASILCFFAAYKVNICLGKDLISVHYQFDKPRVERIVIEGIQYDRINQSGSSGAGEYGEPVLPVKGAYILLPPGVEVSQVEVVGNNKVYLGNEFKIEPGGRPYVLSSAVMPENCIPRPNEQIYNSNEPFPRARYEIVSRQIFRGYNVLIMRLHPFEYFPTSGELYYFPNLEVIVRTCESNRETNVVRRMVQDEAEIRGRIDNPDMLLAYAPVEERPAGNYDLLILTIPSFAASFFPLKAYHDNEGILTEIKTLADIGTNNPTDIRDFIRNAYINDGISYVLIGADDDYIPALDLYAYSWLGGITTNELPGDIYYGCLDGTYNYDSDSRWGESTDGESGGDVDLMAEVYVGRASVDNTAEAERFVSKTLWYLQSGNNFEYRQKVLLVGQWIGLGGLGEYGGDSMDELVDLCETHGYSTYGLPLSSYTIDKLYDRDGFWPSSEVISRINNGRHIINHYGHSNYNLAMKLSNSEVLSELNNNDLFFLYSQGCLAGHFDGMDCWAEYATIKTDHGAFAAIMNVREGFGSYNTTDGPSQRYNREFWDAVFSPSEGKTRLGQALFDCKEDNLYRINEGCMRWCYYEVSLFGDPTISIFGARNIVFEYPDDVPDAFAPDEEINFRVLVNGIGDGTPVSGTGMLHFSIDREPFQTVAMTELSPNEYMAVLPGYPCGTRVEYYVSAEEQLLMRIDDYNARTPKLIAIGSGADTVFSEDFESENGWTISGGDWARGTPAGLGGTGASGPDPSSGHLSANIMGYNLYGNYEDNLSECHVTSPPINCTYFSNVHLVFWRWLGVEVNPYDHTFIRVSNDGVNWVTVWENESEIFDIEWNRKEIDISAIADFQPTVYLRWTMGPTDGGVVYCGWNIDDISIVGHFCSVRPLSILTQTIPNWTEDRSFSFQLMSRGGTGSIIWFDKNDDLSGTGLNLSNEGLLSGIPVTTGITRFTAAVSDEIPSTVEKQFEFIINDAVGILTELLPDATEEIPYSFQLESSGGTGLKTWIDLNDDLAASNMNLSLHGLLSGTASAPGMISFTAKVIDSAGSSDDRSYNLSILRLTICGDIDGDDQIDILDIISLINYKYKGGAEPVFPSDADVNNDTFINILDIIYLINYIYKGGPDPNCP